ncbi:ShlB/FhaC/HecB family hemolysin secretion/activation protein [Haloferula helveola]
MLQIQLEGWEESVVEDGPEPLRIATGLEVPEPELLARRLQPFVGGELKASDLLAIADVVLVHFDLEGYPVVNVDAPQQDFEGGVLRLVVEIGRIGKVGVTRPKYGNPESVRRGLWLRSGQPVMRSALDDQLAWYGRHVFRRPRLFVSPGEEPATADILIGLESAKPWRVNVGYENSGPDLVGRDRILIGAAGMTPGEHLIAWQTVLGTPVSSLHAHALSWEIPFHSLHQSLQLDAAYAEVLTRTLGAGQVFENEGTSWSFGALHKLPLPAMGSWRHSLRSGFEVKGTDQFVLFGAGAFSPGEVRFVHAKVAYQLERRWEDAGVAFQASLVGSPGGLISGNDDADFQAYDPSATSSYLIGRLSGQGWWSPGGDWRIGLRGAGQWSDSRLLPAEQFAAGGYQTVRGVAEREFFADNGWQASVELVTPEWAPVDWLRVRGVGFFDHAWLENRKGSAVSISGTGLGLRVRLSDYVDFRADHGWWVDGRGGRTHFGVTMRY